MNCPYCKQNMGDKTDLLFCPICGHKLERCPSCGRLLTKKVKFCPADGTAIPYEIYINLPDATSNNNSSKDKASKALKIVLVVLIISLILCVFGVGAFVIIKNKLPLKNDKEALQTWIKDDENTSSQIVSKIDSEIVSSEVVGQDEEESYLMQNDVTPEIEEDDFASVVEIKSNSWEDMVKEVRELANADEMIITEAAESYFDSGEADADNYKDASDLYRFLCDEGIITEKTEVEDSYLCSYISERNITEADLQDLERTNTQRLPGDRSLRQMLINELFAKNGYTFKDQELQAFFDEKEWYQKVKETTTMTSDQKVAESRMNSYERENKKFLEKTR